MANVTSDDATTLSIKLPSPHTVALALAVLGRKPPDRTVQQHLDALRRHVISHRNQRGQLFERTSYWRSEYERVNDALAKTLGQNVDLKMQLAALKQSCSQTSAGGTSAVRTGKRKRAAEDNNDNVKKTLKVANEITSVTGAVCNPGRQLVHNAGQNHDMENADTTSESLPVNESHSRKPLIDEGIIILGMFEIQRLLAQQQDVDTSFLALHLVRTASALPHVLASALDQYTARRPQDPTIVSKSTIAVTRACATLVSGFNHIASVGRNAEKLGQVVHSYAHMFKAFLSTLNAAAAYEVVHMEAAQAPEPSSKRKELSRKAKGKAKQQSARSTTVPQVLTTLSSCLIGIVDMLDSRVESSKSLFEAFAHAIITVIGDRLFHSTFGHERGPTAEAELAHGAKNSRSKQALHSSNGVETDPKFAHRLKLEAPCFIQLLKRIMELAPVFMESGSNHETKRAAISTSTMSSSLKSNLDLLARDRLQRTLITAMFGKENGGNLSEEGILIPSPPKQSVVIPKTTDIDVQKWFEQEVWKLLGWEILTREF